MRTGSVCLGHIVSLVPSTNVLASLGLKLQEFLGLCKQEFELCYCVAEQIFEELVLALVMNV